MFLVDTIYLVLGVFKTKLFKRVYVDIVIVSPLFGIFQVEFSISTLTSGEDR